MRHRARLIAALILTALLAGCGWQLRGVPALDNLDALALTGGSNTLRHELLNALEEADVTVHDGASQVLTLSRENWHRRTVATDNRGRAAEIALELSLEWQLTSADDNDTAAPRRELRIRRTFRYDPASATAASDEEELLRDTMYRDAAWRILSQLETLARRQPAAGEDRDAAED